MTKPFTTTEQIVQAIQAAADTGNTGPFTTLAGREYFASDAAAERYLIEQGFTFTGGHPRWPWNYRLVDADVRFNSIGTFIEYRA